MRGRDQLQAAHRRDVRLIYAAGCAPAFLEGAVLLDSFSPPLRLFFFFLARAGTLPFCEMNMFFHLFLFV